MIAIVMEKGEKIATLTLPDELGIPEQIIHNYECSCGRTHKNYLKHVGMHDDGEKYQIQEGDFHE